MSPERLSEDEVLHANEERLFYMKISVTFHKVFKDALVFLDFGETDFQMKWWNNSAILHKTLEDKESYFVLVFQIYKVLNHLPFSLLSLLPFLMLEIWNQVLNLSLK